MKIAIITPSLNPGVMLKEAVDSVEVGRQQVCRNHPNVEIRHVIVDDGSDDRETLRLYEELERNKPHIEFAQSGMLRSGPAAARNVGIRKSEADWIGFLDADDRVDPDGLEALVALALKNPSAQWIFGDTEERREDGGRTRKGVFAAPVVEAACGYAPTFITPGALRRVLAGPPRMFLGGVLVRSRLLEKVGCFREDLIVGEDWYLTLSLTLYSGGWHVPVIVGVFRRGHSSLTQSSRNLRWSCVKPTVMALLDRRFRSERRVLRWTLLTQLVNLRQRAANAGRLGRIVSVGGAAWLVAPEKPSLLRDMFGDLRRTWSKRQ
ncbi:MAG: glycosyltransferase [Spiribacter salinus]|uniref:Glycosyltransferase n=1 Tax=Spiribacter salinus TaxID=1335746 RepID=A0A540VTN7_9GAMM|nr:MAG: glycosyltransferase [Spiribacter salinus]